MTVALAVVPLALQLRDLAQWDWANPALMTRFLCCAAALTLIEVAAARWLARMVIWRRWCGMDFSDGRKPLPFCG
jgi:hypothetical protein